MRMSIIIFDIALTFSARYCASAGEAERNEFAQSAEMKSGSDCDLAEYTLRNAAAVAAPSAIAAAWDQIDGRKADDTATPPFDTDSARWWRQMLGSCFLRMYRKWPCYCGVAKKADEVPPPIGIYFPGRNPPFQKYNTVFERELGAVAV